jgi:putative oxidoreductase
MTYASNATNTSGETGAPRKTTGGRALRFVLWFTQLVLALVFGMAGWMKATFPLETLALYVPWSPHVPAVLVRLIGAAEFLGALALVLPALTRVKPGLTPLAAALLSLTMVFAIGFHLARGESFAVAMPLMLGLLALFVAWGRTTKAPIPAR